MEDQLEELRGKVDRWANLIVNGYLHRRVVWKAFWGEIRLTISCPLPVMTLIEEHRECLTKELYRKLLPAMGVNKNFPSGLLPCIQMFQGLGLPELMIE